MNVRSLWIRAAVIASAAVALAAQKTPDEALRALTEGNRRFATERSVPQPVGEGVRRTLARGQSPFAVVLCCSDSRVPPEHLFNCGLGELFVIRVAGNTCDRETLASVEYAVEHLNVPLCVVLGHESCSAITAAIDQVRSVDNDQVEAAPSQAIQSLIEQIEPAVRKARGRDLGGKALHDACEEENVHLCLHECLRRSPLLRRYVQIGRVAMVGARYHLDSGEVEWLPNRPLPPEPRFDYDPAMHSVPLGVPPHVALRMLQAGHRRFLGDSLPAGDLSATRRESLTHGQQPLAIVLTGADSRVAPEHLFDAGLGELVVIRVAGNVVSDNVLASIEHAASRTGASLLVIMGHTRCDTMSAAAAAPEQKQLTPNMRALLARLEPSVEKARGRSGDAEALVEHAVTTNVLRAAAEIRSRSGILRELEHRGRLAVLPTVYDVASGNLTWLKEVADHAPAAAPGGESAATGQDPDRQAAPAQEPQPAQPQPEPQAPGQPLEQPQEHVHESGGRDGAIAPPEATHDLPLLEWSDPVAASSHEPARPGHGTDRGERDGRHPGRSTAPAGNAGHAEAAHAEARGDAHAPELEIHPTRFEKYDNPWQDPIVIVGMAGVASLLLAAFVALIKR